MTEAAANPVTDFIGLCETAALELAEAIGVHADVLQRDGQQEGEPTGSFTNVISLTIADSTVVDAEHQ